MSSVSGHTAHSERPERSRNAKAQARHRAKRKAYIEQLEQTVTKLQTALGFTPEQVAALPPPLAKIRELEQENARLLKENDDLHRMLADGGRPLPLEVGRRNSLTSFNDSRPCDRDYKRRKMEDEPYISPAHSSHNDALSRPPPLTIPQSSLPHHYNGSAHPSNTTSSSHSGGPSSMFGLNGPPFQIPNTPSGSSSTSSPPFSASPAQMHSTNSPLNHRPTLAPPHSLSNYSQPGNQYVSVKAEDDYSSSNHHHSNHHPSSHSSQGHYTLPPFSQTMPDHAMDNWHGYSSERAPLHR
ncbi:BZIP domain-containing protein [Mycena venus]|uniref:BZIP domain-containing protein n=1 Tax=Mycena venus TaxID=2733690 RepID=A0A8H6XMJ1_9AGAR|nr:BZIP domain-containing protein [Mycena venus]